MEVMAFDDTDQIIEELFDSLLFRYQISLETQMRGSGFIFDCVNVFCQKYHKIDFKHGGSYIDSQDWIKKKKATINPKNDNHRCFQYAARIVLIHEKIKSHPESV